MKVIGNELPASAHEHPMKIKYVFLERFLLLFSRQRCLFAQILLITSRGKSSWIIPGGGIEPNESTSEAALRELYEEAGVKGRIIRELGVFENSERKHRTSVFVVVLEEEFDDWDEKRLRGRQRGWYAIEEAWTMLHLSKPFQFSFLERFILSSPHCLHLLRRLDHS